MDVGQLGAVKKFAQDLRAKGVFYTRYLRDRFEALARSHLTRLMLEWISDGWPPSGGRPVAKADAGIRDAPAGSAPTETLVTVQQEASTTRAVQPASSVALRIVEGIQDDEGFLDLVEQGQQSFERSNAIIQKMTEATQLMGARITQRATELQEVNTERSTDIRRVKQLINAAADDMDNYVSEWGEARPVFSDSFGRGIKAFGLT